MFTFRAKYTSKGETKSSRKWYVSFKAADGRAFRLPTGMVNRKNAEAFGRRLDELAGAVAAHEPLPPGLSAWLESLPAPIIEKLQKWNMLSTVRVSAAQSLDAHLADFHDYLVQKNSSEIHIHNTMTRIERIVETCRFRTLTDIRADAVGEMLHRLRVDDGLSIATRNHHLVALRGFTRWAVREGRLPADPTAPLQRMNAAVDVRRERRALEAEEVAWLLHTTEAGPRHHGLSGPLRSLMYRLAAEAGLRASELESLTRDSFHLDAGTPTVTVRASISKRRMQDRLPLRPATAELVARHLAVLLPGVRLFRGLAVPRHSDMLHVDLAAARAAWIAAAKAPAERKKREGTDFLKDVDEAGRVIDMHGLRHTFGSHLTAAGVNIKTIQTLMRHSTITLTMDRYGHTFAGDESAAIAKLPSFNLPAESEGEVADGTKGK